MGIWDKVFKKKTKNTEQRQLEEKLKELKKEAKNVDVKKSIQEEKIYNSGLQKTRRSFGEKLKLLFASNQIIDENFFDEIEEILITNDLNANLVLNLVEKLKEEVKIHKITNPQTLKELFVTELINLYSFDDSSSQINDQNEGLNVIYFVGVNGAGKTTTVAKLAAKYKKEGKKVLVVAADTFRAGAIEQLKSWAQKIEVDCYAKQLNSDPGSVVYEAIEKAKNEKYDIILCDTSGRLQTKDNLMEELNRIVKISQKHNQAYPHEVLLVIDGNTGQNGLLQAQAFKDKALLTGLVITKLDGTAKGGVAFSVKTQLNIPIKLIGLGEKVEDLKMFNLEQYVRNILGEDFE